MGIWNKLAGASDVIGIDVGSHGIKVVQLQETRQGITLRKAGTKPTPREATKAGVVANSAAVAQTIRELLSALEIEPCGAVAGVAGPAVVVRQVQLPSMSERQLRRSIQWEARNYISFPVEDSVLEFQIMSGNGSGAQMDVMLVATPRDMVETRVEALELAGLEPVALEIEPFAAMRSLVEYPSSVTTATEETIALVGIGASFTDINLVQAGRFVLTRMIPIAGNSLTEAIAGALAMDDDKAEDLKETAMRVVLSEEERSTLDPFAQQASRAVEPLLDELIREVRRSLAYYDYQRQGGEEAGKPAGVNRILLSGGSAKLAGLSEYLQTQLGVPVEVANPFGEERMGAGKVGAENLQAHSSSLVVGTGLALRELMLRTKRSRGRSR
jgi:type IV pilus assembly protein PilM